MRLRLPRSWSRLKPCRASPGADELPIAQRRPYNSFLVLVNTPFGRLTWRRELVRVASKAGLQLEPNGSSNQWLALGSEDRWRRPSGRNKVLAGLSARGAWSPDWSLRTNGGSHATGPARLRRGCKWRLIGCAPAMVNTCCGAVAGDLRPERDQARRGIVQGPECVALKSRRRRWQRCNLSTSARVDAQEHG